MNKVTLSIVAIVLMGIGILTYIYYPGSPVSTNSEQDTLPINSSVGGSLVSAEENMEQIIKITQPKGEYVDCSRSPVVEDRKLCEKHTKDSKQLSKNIEEWAHSVNRSNSGTTASGIAQ